jgi:signal transduction histidine kinase
VADLTTDIMEEVDRINGLITKVLAYTRPSDIHQEQIDVGELLESARSRMCRGLCEKEPSSCDICTVTVDDGVGCVDGDPVLLEQAVVNLFSNARQASPDMAAIELAASRGDDDKVEVTVADRGPGIAEEDRDRVFEPFFTRRSNGVGLGLPAVQKIVDLHKGSITLEARDGGGTLVRLRLPASQPRSRS